MPKSPALCALLSLGLAASAQDGQDVEAFRAMIADRAAVHAAELQASPFSQLRRDFFSRYTLDPQATPRENEVRIDASWRIVLPDQASDTAGLMAGHLVEFFDTAMALSLTVEQSSPNGNDSNRILLVESGVAIRTCEKASPSQYKRSK